MKNIQIVKETKKQKIFHIKEYSFIESETNIPQIPVYRIILEESFVSPLDFRYWLEDINNEIHYLTEIPSELTDYIKKYEENIPFTDNYLFHDLRTRYIDFLLYEIPGVENNVLLIGYTLLENKTCIAIKAFSLLGLVKFSQMFLDYCNQNDITTETEKNLRWVYLEQCILPNTNLERNDICENFLATTLINDYCKIFLQAFSLIDSQGYLDKSFYDKSILINGNEKILRTVNKITKYFSSFWKFQINTKNNNQSVLCLHDEVLNDESVDKVVYTLKPHLMQYYQLHWFEDFCSRFIQNITSDDFKIINFYTGREFNFFQNQIDGDKREIDIILGLEYQGKYKIVAIECKKTLTDDEIKKTNKKIKEKILKSKKNIIDAYIHIGCFNSDVNFDKPFKGIHAKYKQKHLQLEDKDIEDVPYFAFTLSTIADFEAQICYIFNEILKQW